MCAAAMKAHLSSFIAACMPMLCRPTVAVMSRHLAQARSSNLQSGSNSRGLVSPTVLTPRPVVTQMWVVLSSPPPSRICDPSSCEPQRSQGARCSLRSRSKKAWHLSSSGGRKSHPQRPWTVVATTRATSEDLAKIRTQSTCISNKNQSLTRQRMHLSWEALVDLEPAVLTKNTEAASLTQSV